MADNDQVEALRILNNQRKYIPFLEESLKLKEKVAVPDAIKIDKQRKLIALLKGDNKKITLSLAKNIENTVHRMLEQNEKNPTLGIKIEVDRRSHSPISYDRHSSEINLPSTSKDRNKSDYEQRIYRNEREHSSYVKEESNELYHRRSHSRPRENHSISPDFRGNQTNFSHSRMKRSISPPAHRTISPCPRTMHSISPNRHYQNRSRSRSRSLSRGRSFERDNFKSKYSYHQRKHHHERGHHSKYSHKQNEWRDGQYRDNRSRSRGYRSVFNRLGSKINGTKTIGEIDLDEVERTNALQFGQPEKIESSNESNDYKISEEMKRKAIEMIEKDSQEQLLKDLEAVEAEDEIEQQPERIALKYLRRSIDTDIRSHDPRIHENSQRFPSSSFSINNGNNYLPVNRAYRPFVPQQYCDGPSTFHQRYPQPQPYSPSNQSRPQKQTYRDHLLAKQAQEVRMIQQIQTIPKQSQPLTSGDIVVISTTTNPVAASMNESKSPTNLSPKNNPTALSSDSGYKPTQIGKKRRISHYAQRPKEPETDDHPDTTNENIPSTSSTSTIIRTTEIPFETQKCNEKIKPTIISNSNVSTSTKISKVDKYYRNNNWNEPQKLGVKISFKIPKINQNKNNKMLSTSAQPSTSAASISSAAKSSSMKTTENVETSNKHKSEPKRKQSFEKAIVAPQKAIETTSKNDKSRDRQKPDNIERQKSIEEIRKSDRSKSNKNESKECEKQQSDIKEMKKGANEPSLDEIGKKFFADFLTKLLEPNNDVLQRVEELIPSDTLSRLKSFIEISQSNPNQDDSAVSSSTSVNVATESNNDATEHPKEPEIIENENAKKSSQGKRSTKPRSNELSRLNEDIRNMFICKDVLTATGKRVCTMMQNYSETAKPTKPKLKLEKEQNNPTEPNVSETCGSKFPIPSGGRVICRRNTIYENRTLWEEEESSDLTIKDDTPKPSAIPKRIARRRDTFCELIESPNTSPNGQKPIRMRIINRIVSSDSDDETTSITEIDQTTLEKYRIRDCKIILNKNDVDRIMTAQKRTATEAGFSETFEPIESIESSESTSTWQDNGSETGSSCSYDQLNLSKRIKLIKNTNPMFHCKRKTNDCQLCDKKSIRNIIVHYVNEHDRQEVFNARMTPEMTERMRKCGGDVADSKQTSKGHEIIAFCPYCEEQKKYKAPSDWLEHITRHTGEFMKYCTICGIKFAGKLTNSAECTHAPGILRKIQMTDLHLSVYVCNLCNFSQLRQKCVEKHLQKMHDINSNASNHYQLIHIVKNIRKLKQRIQQIEDSEDDDDTNLNKNENDIDSSNTLQSDVFRSSEQDDYDTSTLIFMKETTFEGDKLTKPSTSMIDKLSERFRKQDEIKNLATFKNTNKDSSAIMSNETISNDQLSKYGISNNEYAKNDDNNSVKQIYGAQNNNEKETKGNDSWESCTETDESENDDDEYSMEMASKNKMIQNTLIRLSTSIRKNRQNKTKTKKSKKNANKNSTENDKDKLQMENVFAENKTIKSTTRIENIGFYRNRAILSYFCDDKNCNFEINVLKQFILHLNEHMNIKWSGYCFECLDLVEGNFNATILDEFEHMKTVHLVKLGVEIPSLDESENDRPISPPSLTSLEDIADKNETMHKTITQNSIDTVNATSTDANRPIIKCRRVSGDTLSKSKDKQTLTSILQSHLPSMITNQPKEYKNPLKPWTKCPFIKYETTIKQMLRDVSLIALYKCMSINCIFTTDDPIIMFEHINNHEEHVRLCQNSSNQTKSLDHISWLECSYCDKMEDSCALLIKHIQNVHSTSIYQCAYCFYRTVDPSNIVTHQKMYHAKQELLILVAMGQTKHLYSQIDFMLKGKNEFVHPIKCGDEGCGYQAYNHCAFVSHWTKSDLHKNKKSTKCSICFNEIIQIEFMKHLQTHKIAQIQCIYCQFGCNSAKLMQNHLMDVHPIELPYAACRLLGQNSSDSVQLTRMSEEVQKHLLCSLPLTKNQVNFMRPALDQYEYNAGIIPNDDSPSMICEILDENNRKHHQKMNNEIQIKYNIMNHEKLGSTRSPIRIQQPKPSTSTTTASDENSAPAIPSTNSVILATGDSTIKIAHVAYGVVELKNLNQDLESEIDAAARSLTTGTGLEHDDLYQCDTCKITVKNQLLFLGHLAIHTDLKTFTCTHCTKTFLSGLMLKNHIEIHLSHRYFCYYCNFTGPLQSIVDEHSATTHKCKTIVHPLIKTKKNPKTDFFVVCPSDVKSVENFGIKLIDKNKGKILQTKKYYSSEEADLLPRQSIYTAPVFCKKCSYSTKVRNNMYRHLIYNNCSKNSDTPEMDPVNPVPCLDTGEKYFDKMKNLAASSNTNENLIPNDQKYQFIPEERRYVCGVPTCQYQTQTDDMLRAHIESLHKSERSYSCTHCNHDLCNGKFVMAHIVLSHLCFHGPKLFKCPHCIFIHFLKQKVDKHIDEMHPRCKELTISIQRPKNADILAKSNKSTGCRWKCNICTKTSLDTKNQIKEHIKTIHRLSQQYQCKICPFQSDTKTSVKDHIQQVHGLNDIGHFECIFERIDSENDVTPIWRRDDPNRIKHIRGILFEPTDAISKSPKKSLAKSQPKKKSPAKNPNQQKILNGTLPKNVINTLNENELIIVNETNQSEVQSGQTSPSKGLRIRLGRAAKK